MSLTVEREPIDISTLPANLQKHLDPGAPAKLKMMTARRMLPITPEQNVRMLYQLAIAAGGEVAEEAEKAFGDVPANIVVPVVQKEDHVGVLDWIAARRVADAPIIEAVVSNNATADETVARLASRADARMCDVIATNQVRLLQAPVIVEQLYQNANARMATVDRLLELCRREGVELKGLPGIREALQSDRDIFGEDAEREEDPEFAALLQQEARKAAREDREIPDFDKMSRSEQERYLREQEEKKEEDDEQRVRSMYDKLSRMTIAEKIRFATIGTREAINILVRDPNKLVHSAAVKSPRVRYPDVRNWAKNKSLPDSVIAYIAGNRDYTRHYEVMLNLVNNPKTPLHDTMSFLNHIRTNDLKSLSRNRNVPTQVSRQAKNLWRKRSGGSRR